MLAFSHPHCVSFDAESVMGSEVLLRLYLKMAGPGQKMDSPVPVTMDSASLDLPLPLRVLIT